MTKINTFSCQKQLGFLLLDSMISIVLIGISMLILGRYAFSVIECNHDAQLTLRALNVATELLDRCIHNKKLPDEMTQRIDSFTVAWHVEPVPLPALSHVPTIVSSRVPIFNTVLVTISFKTLRGAVRSYTFTGGFALSREEA